MTSLGHAHFRFRFQGRLHFFRFSRFAPWPLAIFPKFHRQFVGIVGVQKSWGINWDICPPLGGQAPKPQISLFGIVNFFLMWNFRLTSLIDRGMDLLLSRKILKKSDDQFSRKCNLKFLTFWVMRGFTPLGGPHPHLVITSYRYGLSVINAVDRLSISTSGPEIWRFQIFGGCTTWVHYGPETLSQKFHQLADVIELG